MQRPLLVQDVKPIAKLFGTPGPTVTALVAADKLTIAVLGSTWSVPADVAPKLLAEVQAAIVDMM